MIILDVICTLYHDGVKIQQIKLTLKLFLVILAEQLL